jgi:pimeloyl-ACP methyl ester carboxylesterase
MAMKHPTRTAAVYAFGANMDTRGVKPVSFASPVLAKLAKRLAEDYARVAPTPDGFPALRAAVATMQKVEPDYNAADLAAIHGTRVAVVDGDHEEFITRAHTEYLAHTIPGAKLIFLPGVSHFAPWQAPREFNRSMLAFLGSEP